MARYSEPFGLDRTLIKSLIASIILIVVSAYLYPYFAERSSRQAATWHMINANIGGLPGEANLLLAGDQVVMIDSGQRVAAERAVLHYLKTFEIDRIDHFFISEASRSHFGGIATLIHGGVQIDRIYYLKGLAQAFAEPRKRRRFRKYMAFAKENGARIIPVEPGFSVSLPGETRVRVLDVIPEHALREELPFKVSSMLMHFEVAGSKVLFSADIGRDLGAYLLERAEQDPTIREKLAADFFKMPQPDTSNPTPSAFYDLIGAKYVFAPSPKRVWCGGEGALAREWTIDRELPTWFTGTNGNIRVIWQPAEAIILPQYSSGRCKLKEFGSLIVR